MLFLCRIRRILPALLVCLLTCVRVDAQIQGYQLDTTQPFAWIDTSSAEKGGYQVENIALPFTFSLYDHSTNKISFDEEGLVYFVDDIPIVASDTFPFSNFFGTNVPMLGAFWSDWLRSRTDAEAGLRYQVVGVAPDRKFVMSWLNSYSITASGAKKDLSHFTFQVVLYEGSNIIDINFKTLQDPDYPSGANATIGMQKSPTLGQTFFYHGFRFLSGGSQLISDQTTWRFVPQAAPSCNLNALAEAKITSPDAKDSVLQQFVLRAEAYKNTCGPRLLSKSGVTLKAQIPSLNSETTLHDDGMWGDIAPNDGEFAAYLKVPVAGEYTVLLRASDGSSTLPDRSVTVNAGPGYTWSPTTYIWYPTTLALPVSGEPVLGSYPDGVLLSAPFPIKVYGSYFSKVGVTSEGTFSFENGNTVHIALPNVELPVPGLKYSFLALLWDRFSAAPATSKHLFTETLGVAPNRKYVISWENLRYGSSDVGPLAFQVVFYESTGAIQLNYKKVSSVGAQGSNGASATIGIQGDAALGQTYFDRGMYIETQSFGAIPDSTSLVLLPPGVTRAEPTPTPTLNPSASPSPGVVSNANSLIALVTSALQNLYTAERTLGDLKKARSKGAARKVKLKNAPILAARKALLQALQQLEGTSPVSGELLVLSYPQFTVQNVKLCLASFRKATSSKTTLKTAKKEWKTLEALLTKMKLP